MIGSLLNFAHIVQQRSQHQQRAIIDAAPHREHFVVFVALFIHSAQLPQALPIECSPTVN